GLQHDVGFGLQQTVVVLHGDDGRFHHRRMADERAFDLERRHPDPRNLEHVVGPALVGKEAVGVADILVPGAGPATLEGGTALFALVPVALRAGAAAHQHLANLAVADLLALFIDQADLVARYGFAGGAVFEGGGSIANVLVQHLGGTDAVVEVDA